MEEYIESKRLPTSWALIRLERVSYSAQRQIMMWKFYTMAMQGIFIKLIKKFKEDIKNGYKTYDFKIQR